MSGSCGITHGCDRFYWVPPRWGSFPLWSWPVWRFSSGQRANNLAVLSFAEGLQGVSGHVAQRSRRQHESCRRLVSGKLRDQHSVVLSHGQVPGGYLSSCGFGGLLGSVEPLRAFLDFGSALRRVAEQGHVVWHWGCPPWSWNNMPRPFRSQAVARKADISRAISIGHIMC